MDYLHDSFNVNSYERRSWDDCITTHVPAASYTDARNRARHHAAAAYSNRQFMVVADGQTQTYWVWLIPKVRLAARWRPADAQPDKTDAEAWLHYLVEIHKAEQRTLHLVNSEMQYKQQVNLAAKNRERTQKYLEGFMPAQLISTPDDETSPYLLVCGVPVVRGETYVRVGLPRAGHDEDDQDMDEAYGQAVFVASDHAGVLVAIQSRMANYTRARELTSMYHDEIYDWIRAQSSPNGALEVLAQQPERTLQVMLERLSNALVNGSPTERLNALWSLQYVTAAQAGQTKFITDVGDRWGGEPS